MLQIMKDVGGVEMPEYFGKLVSEVGTAQSGGHASAPSPQSASPQAATPVAPSPQAAPPGMPPKGAGGEGRPRT